MSACTGQAVVSNLVTLNVFATDKCWKLPTQGMHVQASDEAHHQAAKIMYKDLAALTTSQDQDPCHAL